MSGNIRPRSIRIPAKEVGADPCEFFPDELPIGGDRGS